MTQFAPLPRIRRFTGAEKSAIMFLCMGEERGGMLMQQLNEAEIRKITRAISSMGEVQSELVEEVMDEFGIKMSGHGGLFGSVDAARTMLATFLPTERVDKILEEIQDKATGNLWVDISKLDEKVLAQFLHKERDQTVAAILSRLEPEMTAKILPLMNRTRAVEIVERILTMGELPEETLHILEDTLRHEVLARYGQDSTASAESTMVSVFNKIDRDLFEELARSLERSVPDRFQAIKKKMFVFDDLVRLDPNQLAKVFREVSGSTLPYALRGATKEVRDHFLSSLPARSRDMLQEEMTSLGPIKSRDVRQAQSDLVEAALSLAQNGEIDLEISEAEEMM